MMTPNVWPKRALGTTGLLVPSLCIGTSELSGWENFYLNPPGEEQALATVRAILDGPGVRQSLERKVGIGTRPHRESCVATFSL